MYYMFHDRNLSIENYLTPSWESPNPWGKVSSCIALFFIVL